MFFDGTCRFCRAQVVRLRRLTRDRVAFRNAYADGARDGFPMLPAGELGEMKFVDAAGRLHGGAAAIAQAFIASGGLLGLGARLYPVPPIRWIADRAYAAAARRRLRLKQTCADDVCATDLPPS